MTDNKRSVGRSLAESVGGKSAESVASNVHSLFKTKPFHSGWFRTGFPVLGLKNDPHHQPTGVDDAATAKNGAPGTP